MTDLLLAFAHHLAIFALAGILAAELVLVRKGMGPEAVQRVAKIDLWYGIMAGVILVVGFSRAYFAAKGWTYYSHNVFFWAKIGAFFLVGLLSALPTIRFIRWRRQASSPADAEIAQVRQVLYAEIGLFALLPIFAAAMARGYWELG